MIKRGIKSGKKKNKKNNNKKNIKKKNNNTTQRHGTITHLVFVLLHRLELLYGKQKTARWRNEMRDIE
jgi:hypothetical protein